jgi:hypothetical protein
MDLHVDLDATWRLEGARAVLAYLVGAALGTLVALPILDALFDFHVPLI